MQRTSDGVAPSDQLRPRKDKGSGPLVTHDFVHFVVHTAANVSGDQCEMCWVKGPIRYA
jgi:hypothetical protein